MAYQAVSYGDTFDAFRRKSHPQRRSHVQDGAITQFGTRIGNILQRYFVDRDLNMDETSWKLLNHGLVTIAEKRSEKVRCLFEGDLKICLTAIVGIDGAGGKLPIWVLSGKNRGRRSPFSHACPSYRGSPAG
jgi:hypothetical protein